MPFYFPELWEYTQRIQEANATDARLFGVHHGPATLQNASLTGSSCTAFAGQSWAYYSGFDTLNRLMTWKVPLITLVASFPRPPLGFWVEMFVVNHLLGDPIRSIADLLDSISGCQDSAVYWRTEHLNLLGSTTTDVRISHERRWKALAMIENAYAEYGAKEEARKALRSLGRCPSKQLLWNAIWDAAKTLAADRVTKTVIVVVLQCVFITSVGVAILRTVAAAGASASSDTVFINVEAHSIAFSAQYFWVIPAVFLASFIGVSQTEAARPNCLLRLKADLDHLPAVSEDIKADFDVLNQYLADIESRTFKGGIPSWKPNAWQRTSPVKATTTEQQRGQLRRAKGAETPPEIELPEKSHSIEDMEAATTSIRAPDDQSRFQHGHSRELPMLLSHMLVVLGTAAGMTISALVPPDGLDCRHIAQMTILSIWLVSAQLDHVLERMFSLDSHASRNRNRLFWCTYAKDFIAMSTTIGGIVATQLGIFNRCSCYTRWGATGLQLPEMPDVAAVLHARLGREYPLIAFSAIVVELLIVPMSIWLCYADAIRVFVQRDDDKEDRPKADSLRILQRLSRKFRSRLQWTFIRIWHWMKLIWMHKIPSDYFVSIWGLPFRVWKNWV